MMTGGVLHSHAAIHFSFLRAPFTIKPGIMTTFTSPSFHSVSHRVLAFLMLVIVLAKLLAKKENRHQSSDEYSTTSSRSNFVYESELLTRRYFLFSLSR